MEIKTATFLISQVDYRKCPTPVYPEYAFIGRSNVGKSSLINMLTGNSKLAKISSTPGKTQTINHFMINDNWYLVDLPGYGYARVSKKDRTRFMGMNYNYLEFRENLQCVFVLIDSRHEAQKNDLDFLAWLGKKGVPFVIVFTKTDKLGSGEANKNLTKYKKKLLTQWEQLPQIILSSAETGRGKDEILNLIEEVNAGFTPPPRRSQTDSQS
ncbi:ribosome biogenesis GTP-binding protein YihA/YsxC [Luteibaculum oceani]|uniref:Probable GTP-binding protein EngB n=1 Tax=Luteibaculum oceani TaxID=1294296 RepID=A0A5C6V1M2_9FLAO|nr:ribosome biogenesis GTP-binding protein YihA/YsxC [Luteibaculum oceani]TXC78884.1 YihA family ribosome biogenesis GTP-binding protein [Luteibaculum oceani]